MPTTARPHRRDTVRPAGRRSAHSADPKSRFGYVCWAVRGVSQLGRSREGGSAVGDGAGSGGNSSVPVLPRTALVSQAGGDGGASASAALRSALGASASAAAVRAARARRVESRSLGHPGPPSWTYGRLTLPVKNGVGPTFRRGSACLERPAGAPRAVLVVYRYSMRPLEKCGCALSRARFWWMS